jgi:putative ABC transport system permease protein
MIKNFFTVAIRNFLRQRLYSFINIFGLASGLICALFIHLWVSDEVNKDKFHNQSEKIFQVVSNLEINKGEILTWTITPGPLAEHIRENIPEVEVAVRTMGTGQLLVQHDEKNFMETGFYADPDFFNLFSFTILRGKPNRDSTDISTISISEKLSKKLFGDGDPLGKTVKVNNQNDYTIGAVFQDIGTESSLQFDYILPLEVYKKNRGQGFNWGNYDHPLYVRLSDPSTVESVTKKIEASVLAAVGRDNTPNLYLQPLAEYYLYSKYENGKPTGGRIEYVRIFSVVAVFILVIACINFMNMATAKAANRSKEVGVRKVVGAQRKSLILQFIAESTLISLVSTIVALSIVYLLLPLFNALVSKQIVIDFSNPGFLISLLLIVVITGLLAGSYPAFVLSSYQPAHVLKGSSAQTPGGSALRKGLVIFQFALTVILIACSLVVYNQIEFIRNKNVGYNRESVLSFSLQGNLRNEFDAFKTEVMQFPGITHVSRSDNSLVHVNNQNGSVTWPGKPDNSIVFFRTVVVDYEFLETMGVQLKEGRFFKKELNDTSTFVISERAVEVMGLQDPVGTVINQWGTSGKVIGVAGDFHSRSLHEAIDPIVFMLNPKWPGRAVVRFHANQAQQAIQQLETIYRKYSPQYPFTYSFLEDDFENLYNNEKVTGSLALAFTAMAIIISGLGLLGLAAYTAERKRKEISIRKTLGASVTGIVTMMSVDFAKLSLAAAIIGCPVAYYLMQKFQEGYAYHPELGWDIFVVTAISVLMISLITVIFQVAKAAIANPIDALRNE